MRYLRRRQRLREIIVDGNYLEIAVKARSRFHRGKITNVTGVKNGRNEKACNPYVWWNGKKAKNTGRPSGVGGGGGYSESASLPEEI